MRGALTNPYSIANWCDAVALSIATANETNRMAAYPTDENSWLWSPLKKEKKHIQVIEVKCEMVFCSLAVKLARFSRLSALFMGLLKGIRRVECECETMLLARYWQHKFISGPTIDEENDDTFGQFHCAFGPEFHVRVCWCALLTRFAIMHICARSARRQTAWRSF